MVFQGKDQVHITLEKLRNHSYLFDEWYLMIIPYEKTKLYWKIHLCVCVMKESKGKSNL